MELGHTKVFCHVTAPTTSDALLSQQTKELSMDQGILLASVQYAPFAYPASHLASSSATPMGSNAMASEHNAGLLRSTLTARQAELAAKITTCLQAVVPLQHYPKTAIHLQLTILQDDGHVLTACLTAASLALVDASVEVHDVVACGSVSGFHHTVSSNQMIFLADPDWMEYHAADASMTLAMLPNLKQVILWEQTGRMSPREANQAMELCRDGCRTLHRFVRQHMIDTTTSNSI
jgi:ribonuclease PH